MTVTAYPLCWPPGWPRTTWEGRSRHLAGAEHRNSQRWEMVTHRLMNELRLLKARNVILSTDQPIRRDGLPYAAKRLIDDPGAAVYFERGSQQYVLAQDTYMDLHDNLRSLALAIEGLRQMERHGGDRIIERAFSGFLALPPPTNRKPWWDVLGVPQDCRLDAAREAHRTLAVRHHPDAGGDTARMAEVNGAWEQARRAIAG